MADTANCFWKFVLKDSVAGTNPAPLIVPNSGKSDKIEALSEETYEIDEYSETQTPQTFISRSSNSRRRNSREGAQTPSIIDTVNITQNNVVSVVDIVNEYPWNVTPPFSAARKEAPRIYLKEKYLKTNSFVAQLLYGVGAATEKAASVLDTLTSSKVGKDLLKTIKKSTKSAVKSTAKATDFTEKEFAKLQIEQSPYPYMKVYDGLYITEPSKFEYIFPYYDDNPLSTINRFSKDDKGGAGSIIKSIMDGGTVKDINLPSMQNILDATAGLNITAPGSFIEKPQFYDFASTGRTVSIKFPLLNTLSYDDVIRNYQLIYLLLYQNTTNRKSRDLIDPPVLYEVFVPGSLFLPYTFMSKFDVSFMGLQREMEVSIPTLEGMKSIKTIVPDAYSINIELTSLIHSSRNMYYTNISHTNIVTTQ